MPQLRGDESATGPLAGYVVADFSLAAAGPFATQILGDLGARIIKIEPLDGDMIRGWDDASSDNLGTYFIGLNRNKQSVALDLKSPYGLAIAHSIVASADIVIEAFRPGVAERLGIGYVKCAELSKDVVYLSISGYGQTGPRVAEPAMDIIVQAVGGIMGITGEPGRPPVKVGAPVADLATGWAAGCAMLAAVVARERGGGGQHVSVAMLDVVMTLLSNHASGYLMNGRDVEKDGSAHPQLVPYQAFPTRDGEYVIVGILNERFWDKFCDAMGRADWRDDPRFETNRERLQHRKALLAEVEEAMLGRTSGEWLELFRRADVPATLVNDLPSLFADEQVDVNAMVATMDAGDNEVVKVLGSPLRLADTRPSLRHPPPRLGQHTRDVLLELGHSTEEIRRWAEQHVIGVASDRRGSV